MDAKFGIQHRFNENTSAKMKVDHNGFVDVVLKHRLSDSFTFALTNNLNVKSKLVED